ncbi:MAG TPA: ATP-binding cassette domain-containing protein [Alphaproteobacteria bacterium]|nr:ATP-binding cassette domain-containing protein [Alphaproteobacteria bacterium]
MLVFDGVRQEAGGRTILVLERWRAAKGEHWLVLGPSGSGKTTLVHLAAGLLEPTEGRVFVDGQDIATLPAVRRDRFRGQRVGIVFQTLHLVEALSVEGNLRLAQYLAGMKQDRTRIANVLESLGLAEKSTLKPRRLSQGEAQRVAIARAVINRPSLILADEPSSALDDSSCEQVIDLLVNQATAVGATLVIATHDARVKERFERRLTLPHDLTSAG